MAGSVLIWVLLGILVIFGLSDKSFKRPAETQRVTKSGLRYLARKQMSVSHYPINYDQFDIFGVRSLRLSIPISVPWITVSSEVVRNGVLYFDIEVRRFWKFVVSVYDNRRASLLDNPCCRLSLISTYTASVEISKIALLSAPFLARHVGDYPYAGDLFKVNHDPRPLAFNRRICLLLNGDKRSYAYNDAAYAEDYQINGGQVCGSQYAAEVGVHIGAGPGCLISGLFLFYGADSVGVSSRYRNICCLGGCASVCFSLAAICLPTYYNCDENGDANDRPHPSFHGPNTVPQQYLLTIDNYRGTVISIGDRPMANVLSRAKQTAIIGALAEGSSIDKVTSPLLTVRASIVQEFREREPEAEA